MNDFYIGLLIIAAGLFTLLAINEYIDRKKKKEIKSS